MQSTELRIEPPEALVTNEYRLNQDKLELRVRDRTSRYYPRQGTAWRALTEDEINAHIALNTVVARWMLSKSSSVHLVDGPNCKWPPRRHGV